MILPIALQQLGWLPNISADLAYVLFVTLSIYIMICLLLSWKFANVTAKLDLNDCLDDKCSEDKFPLPLNRKRKQ